ncbi:hypothetical protein [Cryobacterium zhongshanensis]|uniref:Uncharacterized protein n=1 Tax=Cryobacterium zhongshanensis TaxID=2928153 RepID=A0AA41QUD2_9MICO|nr:hypothetical protein [Cryobacterium zhongshanensis]MCI4657333.1 hypothetical protein [Cryobacterium zhongshanensis]
MSSKDREFRSRIYEWVGEATVISVQIESQMKRLLSLVDGGDAGSFVEVEPMWSEVAEPLRAAAKELAAAEPAVAVKSIDSAETQVLAALLWADQHHVA